MIFKGDKIQLRPFVQDDYLVTATWRHDQELRKLSQIHLYPVTDVLEREWIDGILNCKSDKNIYYAIESIIEKKIVGYFLLKNINWISRIAWLGIVIGEKNTRGKGFGREAMELGLKYSFNYLNLRKISLEVLSENRAAFSLYKKLGFVEEGLLKNHFYFNGEYLDIRIMSLFPFSNTDNLC